MNYDFAERIVVEAVDKLVNLSVFEIAETAFETEFYINIVEYLIKNLSHFLRLCHEPAASCLVGDSWKRAAHVKVDFLVTHHLALVGEAYYLLSVVAKYLWR